MFDHVKFGVSDYAASKAFFPVAKTMVRLACARSTTRITMQLSSLVRTGTTSKWFATNPRPNPSIAFADPKFPNPTFSVYEERMHRWVTMPPGIEHMV